MKTFVIPDLHLPFTDLKALKKVIKLIKKERPTHVVQLGDLFDLYTFSRYPRSLNISTPQEEIKKGLKLARWFWQEVRKAVPRSKCYQLKGNHDARLMKKLIVHAPEYEHLIDIDSMFRFEGVTTLKSDRDHLELDGIVYCHGFLSNSEKHITHFGKSVVHGHLHRPCIVTKGRLWSMDCGHLADESALPLQYTASKVTGWCKAVGIVEDGHPRLILIK